MLAGIYIMIYQVIVILLLIGTLFKNRIKTESYNLLYVFNTMLAWSNLFMLLSFLAEFFMAWYNHDPYEWYAFKINIQEGYRQWVSIVSIFSFVFGLLMMLWKLRTNRLLTLVFLLSNCFSFFETLVIFITSLYRDFLPTTWSSYNYYMYGLIFIILLLILIYVWAKKKERLPYPSVFLK